MGLGAVAFAVLLVLSRGLTFFADEWAVIADRTLSMDGFLQPFNEHWLGVTTLVYRQMLAVFGLSSYVPYLLLLWALHVVVGVEVYLVVRRRAGSLLAIAAAAVTLFLGSGFENLFWAMQIGFVGAIALGLAALLLVTTAAPPTTGRLVVAAVLLLVGVMTSGFGLFMLALVALAMLLTPGRRRAVAVVLPAAVVYLAWYLTLGRGGLATHQNPFDPAAISAVPGFVVNGLGMAFGSAVGVGPTIGVAVAMVVGLAIVIALARGHDAWFAAACFGAIVAQYGVLGLVRAQLFDTAANYSRYAYLGAIIALLCLTALVAPAWRAAGERGRWRTMRLAVLLPVLALSLTWNGWLLVDGSRLFLARADRTRADLVTATLEMPPGVDPARVKLLDRPVVRLREVIAEYGAPLRDAWTGIERPIQPELMAQARYELINPLPNQVVQPGE